MRAGAGATILAGLVYHRLRGLHRVRLEEDGSSGPRHALALETRVRAEEIDYANLHGTSTVLNDRIETRALKLALGPRAREIPTSSLKSMIGHPQGACGAAGVVATILGMREEFLPPTINLDDPDPNCDLDYLPNIAPRTIAPPLHCIGFGSKNSGSSLVSPGHPPRENPLLPARSYEQETSSLRQQR